MFKKLKELIAQGKTDEEIKAILGDALERQDDDEVLPPAPPQPQVPVQPSAPAQVKPEVPSQVKPEVPSQVQPQVPSQVKPEAPAQVQPQVIPKPRPEIGIVEDTKIKEAEEAVEISKKVLRRFNRMVKEIKRDLKAEREGTPRAVNKIKVDLRKKERELRIIQRKILKLKTRAVKHKKTIGQWKQWYEEIEEGDKTAEREKLKNEIDRRAVLITQLEEEIGSTFSVEASIKRTIDKFNAKLTILDQEKVEGPIEEDPRLLDLLEQQKKASVRLESALAELERLKSLPPAVQPAAALVDTTPAETPPDDIPTVEISTVDTLLEEEKKIKEEEEKKKKKVEELRKREERELKIKDAEENVEVAKKVLRRLNRMVKEITRELKGEREGVPKAINKIKADFRLKQHELRMIQRKIAKLKMRSRNQKNTIGQWKQWYEDISEGDKTAEREKLKLEIDRRALVITKLEEEIGNMIPVESTIKRSIDKLDAKLTILDQEKVEGPIEKDPRLLDLLEQQKKASARLESVQATLAILKK